MLSSEKMERRLKSKSSQTDIAALLKSITDLQAEFAAAEDLCLINDTSVNEKAFALFERYNKIKLELKKYIPQAEIEAVESAVAAAVESHLHQIDIMAAYAGADKVMAKQHDVEVERKRTFMDKIKKNGKRRKRDEEEIVGCCVSLIVVFGIGIPFTILAGLGASTDIFITFLVKSGVRSSIASTQMNKLAMTNKLAAISADLANEKNQSPAALLRRGFFSLANARYNKPHAAEDMPEIAKSWEQLLPVTYDRFKTKREYIKQERQREKTIKSGTLSLRHAVMNDNLQSVVKLVEKYGHDRLIMNGIGPYITRGSYMGRSPLFMAVNKGDAAAVRALLQSPVIDVNVQDDLYWTLDFSRDDRFVDTYNTLLTAALGLGHTEIAEILLSQPGIDINVQSECKQTPLICAVRRSPTLIPRLLTFKDIDLNVKDKDGRTALHYACFTDKKYKNEIQALLKAPGINPNIADRHEGGWTPLMYAAEHGDNHLVQALIRIGADPAFKNKDGLDAEAIAILHGHTAIAIHIKNIASQQVQVEPQATRLAV